MANAQLMFAAAAIFVTTWMGCLGPSLTGACAEELGEPLIEQRLADLESEVSSLRAQSHHRPARCPNCEGTCCCRPAQLEFGTEVAFLAPHSTTGLGPSGIAFFPSTDMTPSWRTWLSYSGSNGLGVRARYWEFDHLVSNSQNSFTYGLDAYTVDLELTYSKLIGRDWDVLISSGVRHFGFHEDRNFNASSFVDSDLTGLTFGGEIKRNLIGHLRTYGVARGAGVYGDLSGEVPSGFIVNLKNHNVFMWETQVGLEYCRTTPCGDLSMRLGAEAMHWDSVSYKVISGTDSAAESVGLVGLVTGITLRR